MCKDRECVKSEINAEGPAAERESKCEVGVRDKPASLLYCRADNKDGDMLRIHMRAVRSQREGGDGNLNAVA
jgi:hypothetical protein